MESWLAFAHGSWVLWVSHSSYLIRSEIRDVETEALSKHIGGPGIRTVEPDTARFELWIFVCFDKEVGRILFPSTLLAYVTVELVLVARCHGDGKIRNADLICTATGDGYVFRGCVVGVFVMFHDDVFELARLYGLLAMTSSYLITVAVE